MVDLRLEDGNGLDLLKGAIEEGCRKPIILLTAYGDDETRRQALELGADEFFSKPLDFLVLKEKLLN